MNAKTLFLLAALIGVAFLPASFAQIGIKAGVNLANMAQDESIENYSDYEKKSVVGFQAGLTLDLGLSDLFTIQPEVLYIQKGGKSTFTANDNNKLESRYYYNYVEVPVLAKLKFYGADGGSGFYFLAGPYVSLALSGKVKTDLTVLGQTTSTEDDFVFNNDDARARAKRLDYGVSFGGGIKINRLFLDLRYSYGLNNVLDNDADNNNDDKPFLRHRGIGLTAGVEF